MIPTSENSECTAVGVNNFGLGAIRKAISPGKNGIFASTSVVSVMAMTLLGAKGKTALQLKTSLTHDQDRNDDDDPMLGSIGSSTDEDEVDGMVHPPSTEMEIDSIGSSTKESSVITPHRRSRLKKMKDVSICFVVSLK